MWCLYCERIAEVVDEEGEEGEEESIEVKMEGK